MTLFLRAKELCEATRLLLGVGKVDVELLKRGHPKSCIERQRA